MIYNPDILSTVKALRNLPCHYDTIDEERDWCGSPILDKKWIHAREAHMFTLISLSEAKLFTMEKFPVWTSSIPKERMD